MIPTIQQLRYQGFKVRVLHKRTTKPFKKISGEYTMLNEKGGTTTIEITTPDKQYTAQGISECSAKELWNRKIGNKIALGRALNNLKNMQNE